MDASASSFHLLELGTGTCYVPCWEPHIGVHSVPPNVQLSSRCKSQHLICSGHCRVISSLQLLNCNGVRHNILASKGHQLLEHMQLINPSAAMSVSGALPE